MSNPEKTKVDAKEDSDEQWSDEESAARDIVLGLPALQRQRENVGVSRVTEHEANLNEQAVVAAELVIAAAEEAVMKEKSDGKKKKKVVSKPRKTMMKVKDDAAGGSSKGGDTSKPKRRSSELTNPPKGPPQCNICGKGFGSWKAVFGHMRCHKHRNYQGFLPPPKFSAAAAQRPLMIPGPNSAFRLVTARGGSSGGFVAGGSGGSGASGGERGRGLGIDLNVDPVEKDDKEETESEAKAKFDLNKPPPKDEEDKDKAK